MELIYGPVLSQRFGSTLGVNLLGSQKACSYNCVYCHLGPTQLTMNKIRKAYEFPTADQMREAFRSYIKRSVQTDAIVIAGNGEPTLHPQFDEMIQLLIELRREHLPETKIITLSNGAHLDSRKVITGLNLIDERVIKFDAGGEAVMQAVNDPLVRINLAKILGGVRKLKDCTVQSLFVTGEVNNVSNEAIDEWIEVLGMIKPKAVQICTMTRPGFASNVHAVEDDVLYGIAFKLKKRTGLESDVFTVQKS